MGVNLAGSFFRIYVIAFLNLRLSQKSPSNGTNLQSQTVPLSTEMHIPPFSQGFRCAQKSSVLARTPWKDKKFDLFFTSFKQNAFYIYIFYRYLNFTINFVLLLLIWIRATLIILLCFGSCNIVVFGLVSTEVIFEIQLLIKLIVHAHLEQHFKP